MRALSVAGWLGHEWSLGRRRLHDRHRVVAIALIGLSGGLVATFLIARGELAGSDARAYWAAVRIWLDGGDPYHPPAPFLPFVYAPWTLALFVPWALLPWTVAWFLLRGMSILLLIWTAHWAYERRPLATAILLAILAAPIAATFDTGNITLILAMLVWAAQFTGPRVGGLLWAVATSLKWFPAALIVFLPPRTRLWGIAALAVTGILLVSTWPQTLIHLDLALYYPRPPRLDLLLLAWAAVPWLWRKEAFWQLDRGRIAALMSDWRLRLADGWRSFRHSDAPATEARRVVEARLRAFFGVG